MLCFRKTTERYNNMALSAAEKQRRYREKRDADPERRQKWLTYQKTKYKLDKKQGKKKLVKDMTPREHRKEQKQWKKRQEQCREHKKHLQQQETPPNTPAVNPSPPASEPSSFGRTNHNRLRRKREQMKKTIASLEQQLHDQKKKTKLYQKRLSRLGQTSNGTPRSKSRELLRKSTQDTNSKKTVRKTLEFHFSLIEQIKRNYKERKTSVHDIVRGEILRKYRFRNLAGSLIGCSPYKNHTRKKKGCLSSRLKESVQTFFERDDVSTLTSGKESTIT